MPGEWTVATLKEHFDALREADQRAIASALGSADKAVTKADAANEKRFDGVNEFRKALADQSMSLLPRREFDAQHAALLDTLAVLSERLTRSEGKREGFGSTGQMIFQLIVASGVVASILLSLFRHG